MCAFYDLVKWRFGAWCVHLGSGNPLEVESIEQRYKNISMQSLLATFLQGSQLSLFWSVTHSFTSNLTLSLCPAIISLHPASPQARERGRERGRKRGGEEGEREREWGRERGRERDVPQSHTTCRVWHWLNLSLAQFVKLLASMYWLLWVPDNTGKKEEEKKRRKKKKGKKKGKKRKKKKNMNVTLQNSFAHNKHIFCS